MGTTHARAQTSIALLVAVVAVILAAWLVPAPSPAGAQTPPAEDPLAPYLELVGPVASPVCADAALASFVTPTVLGAELAALVAQLIGPVFIVCGSVPVQDGARTCALDASVRDLFDQALIAVSGSTLPVALVGDGTAVDEVALIEDRVDLMPPTLTPTLDAVLQCEQNQGVDFPPLPEPPPLPVPLAAPPVSSAPALLPDLPIAGYTAPPLPPVVRATPVPPVAAPRSGAVTLVRSGPLPFKYPVVFVLPLALLALGGALSHTLTQPVTVRRLRSS